MSLASTTQYKLAVALVDPAAALDIVTNINTPTPAATTITATNANALVVGQTGATNPAFQVDTSTASSATGVKVKSAAAAGGVAVSAISSGANESLTLDAKGTGTVTIAGVSTGIVSIGRGAVKGIVESYTKTNLGAGAVTPTAAQLLGGYITGAQSANTVTLDTAANIDAAIPGAATGDSFMTFYTNTGAGIGTITTATGLTLIGTVAVGAGKNAILRFVKTGVATYDVIIAVSA